MNHIQIFELFKCFEVFSPELDQKTEETSNYPGLIFRQTTVKWVIYWQSSFELLNEPQWAIHSYSGVLLRFCKKSQKLRLWGKM